MADFTYAARVTPYKDRLNDEMEEARRRAEEYGAGTERLYREDLAARAALTDRQIAETEASYGRQFDINAAQQLAGERRLREQMANAGLTASGFNASNLTALALQRSRADAKARAAGQQAADALRQDLMNYESEARSEQVKDALAYRQDLEKAAADTAYKLYASDLSEAEKLRQYVDSHNRDVYKLMYEAFSSGNAALGGEYAKQLWQLEDGAAGQGGFDVSGAASHSRQIAAAKTAGGQKKETDLTEMGYPSAFNEAVKTAANLKKEHKHYSAMDCLYFAVRNSSIPLTEDHVRAMCNQAGVPYEVLAFCFENGMTPTQFKARAKG